MVTTNTMRCLELTTRSVTCQRTDVMRVKKAPSQSENA